MPLILPTQREKRRYILIILKKADENFIYDFFKEYKEIFGIYGLSKVGLKYLEEYTKDNKIFVFRINREYSYTILNILGFLKINPYIVKKFVTLKRLKNYIKTLYNLGKDVKQFDNF